MARLAGPNPVINVEYILSSKYEARSSPEEDPFRHQSVANSHNHHELHPWGTKIFPGSEAFDALYAQANNQYMYHLWYSPALAPYMATKMIHMEPLSEAIIAKMANILRVELEYGIEAALRTEHGKEVAIAIQNIMDSAKLAPDDQIFVRFGATSAKDSFAINVPTTKPTSMPPKGELVLRRLLTSGRTVGRILALSDRIWADDPGEALIIQKWSPDIELRREFRVFCYEGRVTAISQDIWWEKLGWREQYSDGFVDAITVLWDGVKSHLPFSTCTMDVLMTPQDGVPNWKAGIIEFNGFGAHLNTGSDLFHWVHDADTLQGRKPGITVRFVDDWEGCDLSLKMENGAGPQTPDEKQEPLDDDDPDWLALEKKLRCQYGRSVNEVGKLPPEKKLSLPLRGRWCSAY
ncbi:hypothetical protein K469DRAFT_543630 [Zopfia rhizophila CBS 207.26]|uniref:Uncharacterized protein n=1 Tax=Zopfia rhizophila CBS 207.26 TaxID=1314779 RepID=A0A6A6EW75_9PEZI|nr:hypothetical protein K469DRAFT_543630 [Zopfia rhizophila CBS 207.26]